jgi:hypothetical protein
MIAYTLSSFLTRIQNFKNSFEFPFFAPFKELKKRFINKIQLLLLFFEKLAHQS